MAEKCRFLASQLDKPLNLTSNPHLVRPVLSRSWIRWSLENPSFDYEYFYDIYVETRLVWAVQFGVLWLSFNSHLSSALHTKRRHCKRFHVCKVNTTDISPLKDLVAATALALLAKSRLSFKSFHLGKDWDLSNVIQNYTHSPYWLQKHNGEVLWNYFMQFCVGTE